MPHPVKGFAYVAKDCKDFFAFVKRFTEGIVDVGELMTVESPGINPDCIAVSMS